MSLHVFGSNTFSGSNGLLSNVSGIRRQQVSRLNAYVRGKRASPKQARALRKAQYKEKLATSNLPKDVRISLAANPLQLGAPRCFKVLLAGKDVVVDAKLHDKSRFVDEGHHIHFAQFGIPGKGVRLNHEWINPDHITVSANHRVYTLKTQDGDGNPFNMHIDFTQLSRPVGHIETADGYLAMTLEPYALSFNVNVSANAGAGYDSATNTLTWDENSTQWKAANWEQNSMIFSYDTVAVKSPFGSPILINEVSFEDTKTARNGKTMPACVTTIKPAFVMSPPTVRTSDTIKSVFPQDSIFQFDELGVNFTGAYRITQDGSTPPVYAVVGTGVMPVNQVTTREATNKSRSLFETKITPYPRIFSMSRNDISSSLPITGLLNNDPMSPSTTDPTGYVDTVSQTANQDFHDIVCYYMDPDIHTTFISATPTVLSDSTVQAIATDSPDNAAFYKTLQVPYVTSILGNSTLPEGKQCNAVRSNAQLRELPANSPIYQRQSDALYRHRFLQLFPAIQSYLDDQANTDYAALIASAGATMAADIKAKAAGIVPSNPQDVKAAADALTSALADLQSLQDWATSQKLFYAFELYWYCENYFLPVLIAQSADGSLSASVARTMKKLTLIFGVLENGQQNPNGKSFTEAFNDLVRLFQMSSIIPQFVDPNTTSGDLDSLEKEMLQQFYHDNISSSDPNVVQEAQNAQQLAADDTLRRNFFNSLATSMAFGGSLGSWATIAQLNQEFLDAAGWYKKLVNAAGLTSTFLRTSCIAFMIMPMLNAFGGWGGMSATQKATWAITAADLGLTFLVKTIQGALRLYYFWDDLGSFAPRLKALFGFGKFVENLPDAAAETQNIFAQWFIRGNRELRDMGGEGLLEAQEVTTGMKIFGRSAGEFLTNCVGAVLAGVNIVMSAINLAKTSDPLEKAMDSLMIASGGLQLLAIGANWAVTAEIVTSDLAVSIFETVAAVAGPLAIAAAFAGLVIVIVMAFTDSTPPNPVQDFVDKYAEPAGLKMDFDTAIDYLNVVPPDSSATSLNGISFEAQLTGSSSPSAIQLGVQFVATRNNKFLTLKKQSDGTSIIDLDTVDNSGNPNSDPMRAVVWTLTLQSMSPSDFSYLQQNWQLNTNQTDEQNSVTFSGATSDPLSWSITPALPSFLTLGSTDGTICQVSGVKPAVTPATEFTVTASINILGKTYSKTAEVTISVVDPSAGSAALTALLETINGDGGVITSGFAATPKENGFKARATFTQASSTPAANGGLAQSLRRNVSLQDDAVDFEKLQENYAVFLQSAPGLFLWQQPQPVQLNQHYTATAAIDKMQNSLTGSWDRMTSPFTSDNISYESIYFPSPAACPPPGTNDPLDYHGAAEAFVVQSIYNGDGYAQVRSSIECY
ncbi:Jerky protein-like protein-like [Colletotrichum sp. SAR11_240]|nr:Jerky protein-like protein-like [Colletotrichum sp. SAR11_240]